MSNKLFIVFLLFSSLMILITSCNGDKEESLFTLIDNSESNLDFSNELPVSIDLNILNYMYYYNGGGVGVADFNNDGFKDVMFSSNLGAEKMYLNDGLSSFFDVSEKVKVDGGDNSWTNGIAVGDINGDGLIDIYLSQVGSYRSLKTPNKLFICDGISDDGIPSYTEMSKAYGLDFKGMSTQAGLFDYDLDGDLDLYLMNHSLHHNGTFGKRSDFKNTIDSISGDKLFRNDGASFTDVTQESGIYSNVIGYGLGLAFSDINLDGYPDIYICNDFHENDYLYINQGDGTFVEEIEDQMMHTSRFSMGVDIADINNDLWPDVMTLDMLPYDPKILKQSEGEDALDIFNFKLGYGYNHQFAKNALQLNTGKNRFKEMASFANVHASDWSWSTLLFDMDMDGNKDIFISNGIPKRMNDIDYINFISGNEVQYKIQFDKLEEKDMSVIDKIPEIKIFNKFYINGGDLQFNELENTKSNNKISYSNSAMYADFDNDGDYDIITNNINDKTFYYKNNLKAKTLKVKLVGDSKNRFAIGAKVLVFSGDKKSIYENFSTKAFQSSGIDDILVPNSNTIDSIIVIWPDNSFKTITGLFDIEIEIKNENAKNIFDYNRLVKQAELKLTSIAASLNINYNHIENAFVEFNREPLIPHSTSSEGPALIVGDLNNDNIDDFYIGSSKRKKGAVFIQNKYSRFNIVHRDLIDSTYEEVDGFVSDINNDGFNDLLIGTGVNEFRLNSDYTKQLCVFGNKDGLTSPQTLSFNSTSSVLANADFDSDGDQDIFVGSRANPWNYSEVPTSFLLSNDGNGNYTDVTNELAKDIQEFGMVKDAEWVDIDNDKDLDLIVAIEWDGIYLLENDNGQFKKRALTDKKGWWNFLLPFDIDNDGDLDILAGNQGLNNRFQPNEKEPVIMYYNDFDSNGVKEQILTYFLDGREVPFSNFKELQKQLPSIKKKYIKAKDFSEASITDIFGEAKIKTSLKLVANYFHNSILINNGKNEFEVLPLENEVQFTPYKSAVNYDFNEDGYLDVFMGGNYYDCNIQMGRYDADFGTILMNDKNGGFYIAETSGVMIKGQIRNIEKIKLANGTTAFLIARNNDSLEVLKIEKE